MENASERSSRDVLEQMGPLVTAGDGNEHDVCDIAGIGKISSFKLRLLLMLSYQRGFWLAGVSWVPSAKVF